MTHWPLPATLPAEELRALRAGGRRRRFERGATLFHQGDPADHLLLLESGHVTTRLRSRTGDQAILAVLGPGTVFGEPAATSAPAVRRVTATALQGGTAVVVTPARYDRLRSRCPEVDRIRLVAQAEQQSDLAHQLLAMISGSARDRVVQRLAELTERFGTVVPVTQEDLALMAGTTRPTVNEILRELERAEVLRTGRGRILIVAPDRLSATHPSTSSGHPSTSSGHPSTSSGHPSSSGRVRVLRPTG